MAHNSCSSDSRPPREKHTGRVNQTTHPTRPSVAPHLTVATMTHRLLAHRSLAASHHRLLYARFTMSSLKYKLTPTFLADGNALR